MTKTTKPGGGARFQALKNKLKGKGKSDVAAKAIAATVGRKKYGKKKMGQFAAQGRKRAAR